MTNEPEKCPKCGFTDSGAWDGGDRTVKEIHVVGGDDCLRRQLAAEKQRGDDAEAERDDDRRTKGELFDKLWSLVYPGKTDWEYPGMVYRHVKALVDELKAKVAVLEAKGE